MHKRGSSPRQSVAGGYSSPSATVTVTVTTDLDVPCPSNHRRLQVWRWSGGGVEMGVSRATPGEQGQEEQ